MPNYRRADAKGGTYFFTVVTYRRQHFLCEKRVRDALREGIETTRASNPFTIDAFVLLPDHLHCIWTLPENDANFSLRWAMIKRHVSKICGPVLFRDEWMTDSKRRRKESTLWQRRFWEHLIRNDDDYRNHVDYIHFNPVRHELTKAPREWPYSSFHKYVQQGKYGPAWGEGEHIAFKDVLKPGPNVTKWE